MHNGEVIHGDLTTSNLMVRDVIADAYRQHQANSVASGTVATAAAAAAADDASIHSVNQTSGGCGGGNSSGLRVGSTSGGGGSGSSPSKISLTVIDFGLSSVSGQHEDKAVDL
jgi:hypothetical protein